MQLIEKLKSKKAVIGIVGMGYVGLPLFLRYAEVGYRVIGIDIDQDRVDCLNSGKSYIEHISSEKIIKAFAGDTCAVINFEEVGKVDALIICVPTPLNKYREPDLSFVTSTLDSVKGYLRKDQVLSLESTTYPGTTDELLLPVIESQGLTVGKDFYLVYSPEREDPGNASYSTQTIPKVCGGVTAACLEVGVALYQEIVEKVIAVSSTRTAEMTKLLENIHRAVNIGLVNEMKIVADSMGIDIYEVIDAAATKPFGFTPFYPGPGLGGHCIPVDPFYLTWKAREFGLHTRFIELSGEINASMSDWVIKKVTDALNQREKPVMGSRILVLGIAYKPNVDDMRESPSVILMEKLQKQGAEILYSDPHIPVFPKLREHFFDLKSVDLTADVIKSFDCILVATNHDAFDYELIREHAKLIVDSRGVYRDQFDNLVKA